MASSNSNPTLPSRGPVSGDRRKGDTELLAGRIVVVAWLFWIAAFFVGQIVGAIAPAVVADIAVLLVVRLLAYVVLRWERISAWAITGAALLWPVGFAILVSATGGDNIAAATMVTFILFAFPGLVAGVLILDSRRRLKTR